jgi:hypothetical protein
MVYMTQNYWDFGHYPLSRILKIENKMFQKLDPSGDGRKTPTLLGPLERANLNHWSSAQLHGIS